MNTQTTTCTHCGNEIVRSLAVPVWSHTGGLFAGSTRCDNGVGTKATPHTHAFVDGECIKFGCEATL